MRVVKMACVEKGCHGQVSQEVCNGAHDIGGVKCELTRSRLQCHLRIEMQFFPRLSRSQQEFDGNSECC
jgi:hypothetical protein